MARKEVERSAVVLGRSEAILKAVANAARTFAGQVPWEQRIATVLRRLGEAAGVSRTYLFENKVGPDGELLMDQRFEW